MRTTLTVFHRYVGLAIATFLFVAGLTGAIIAWHDELDRFLNPSLMRATTIGTPLPAGLVARAIETRDPHARVTYLPLAAAPHATLQAFVQPRDDPQTGRPYALDYNQVFLDPVTGAELGRREWGRTWPISRETVIPFLYKLHYSLHVPAVWGEDRIGIWLMGAIAAVWCLDCFVGFYLTLPRHSHEPQSHAAARTWWSRWGPAWKIKTGASSFRVVFDIHRAFGLWTWVLLVIVAFTGFSLALDREILRPILSKVARLTPSPTDAVPPASRQIEPSMGLGELVMRARDEGRRRGSHEALGAISYDPARGIYGAHFMKAGDDTGAGGVEPYTLYIDGRDGRLLGERKPWSGTTADIFLQAQFPLHSGRLLGVFGRILVSTVGLTVATLSMSGIFIWWRKRVARVARCRALDATTARS